MIPHSADKQAVSLLKRDSVIAYHIQWITVSETGN